MAQDSCKNDGTLKFTEYPKCLVVALGGFLQDASL